MKDSKVLAFFNNLSKTWKAISAGTKPDDNIHPYTIQVMKEVGVDVSKQKPKLLTREMIEKAGMRLRPIILTSVTTVLGLSSLIFFASGQALILQPMAISLGFGIAWATVLNLLYVPLMYAVIYRVKN